MKIVAVVSGKGGVGKSALACSAAAIIARDEKKVLLFDGNLGLPNCDVYSGIEAACTLGHIVRDGRDLRDAVVKSASGVDLISGGSGWKELAELDSAGIEKLIGSLLELAREYDHVIIDCAPGFGSRVNPFFMVADAAMMVTSGEATSLMDAYAVTKFAWDLKPDLTIGLVVNRVASLPQGRIVGNEVKTIVGQFLSREIYLWGSVRLDTHVEKACAERRCFAEAHPLAHASQDCIDLANSIMGGKVAEIEEEVSVFTKLKSVFNKKDGTEAHAEAA